MPDTQTDPLGEAVRQLFGLPYLFPYQRLVTANLLEAASSSGIPIRWPSRNGEDTDSGAEDQADLPACSSGPEDSGTNAFTSDSAGRGRQLVILPTGAGKSLCFQLPAMLMEGTTLVLYPILSLMADQERRLREKGFVPVLLRGGQSGEEREALFRRIRSGECRFIIANPEVLLTGRMKEALPSLNIVHVVIDEAHCVSEWGESFRPSYLRIGEIIEALRPGAPGDSGPMLTAFTATAGAPVLEKIERYVFGGAGITHIIGNPGRDNIAYSAQGALLKNLAVRDLLLWNSLPAIVFCSSREGTERLARYLRPWFPETDCSGVRFYHAGLSREEKTAVETWFFGSPGGILVSTCAYGMGVDKANIRTVIHRDCPPSAEAYLQESGRAGRDGLESKAILLWGEDDEHILRRRDSPADKKRAQKLLDYARDTSSCRREALLSFMDYLPAGQYPEKPETPCCDVCTGKASPDYREADSLSGFFRRNRRCYTLEQAAAVLGADGTSWQEEEAKSALLSMIRLGRLRVERRFPWKGKISPAS